MNLSNISTYLQVDLRARPRHGQVPGQAGRHQQHAAAGAEGPHGVGHGRAGGGGQQGQLPVRAAGEHWWLDLPTNIREVSRYPDKVPY